MAQLHTSNAPMRGHLDSVHEKNDQATDRFAHGRSAFGPPHSQRGLDRFPTYLRSSSGRVPVEFVGTQNLEVRIEHAEPFFRELESAWNSGPDLSDRDVHARFRSLTRPDMEGDLTCHRRRALVSDFLNSAAAALEALSRGQRSEIASLEEHARQLSLHDNPKENE